jgi:5-hydroxyisourate hydrolase-like protein (transthyretin family)
MKFFLAFAAAMLFGGAAALADGMVTVHVVDAKSGKPVTGQNVRLTNAFGDYVATTNKHGDALFMSVPSGRASVDAGGRSYVSRCQPYFTVSNDQHRIVIVRVQPNAPTGQTGPLCAQSGLVQPGVGADVYNIF